MKISFLMMVLPLIGFPLSTAAGHPDAVVQKLYGQVVERHPVGIPKGDDKSAIWPVLSNKLIERLETAQACENDYFRQHPVSEGKPEFAWLETGLFSGGNEEAIPAGAVVRHIQRQKDGSFHV